MGLLYGLMNFKGWVMDTKNVLEMNTEELKENYNYKLLIWYSFEDDVWFVRIPAFKHLFFEGGLTQGKTLEDAMKWAVYLKQDVIEYCQDNHIDIPPSDID